MHLLPFRNPVQHGVFRIFELLFALVLWGCCFVVLRCFKVIFVLAFFFFAVAPLLTFVHEFGHAVLPLFLGEDVIVRVGTYGGSRFFFGPLSIVYGPWLPWVGHADWSGETEIWRLAFGPLTSLVLTFIIFYLIKKIKYPSFLLDSPEGVSDSKQIVDILLARQPVN